VDIIQQLKTILIQLKLLDHELSAPQNVAPDFRKEINSCKIAITEREQVIAQSLLQKNNGPKGRTLPKRCANTQTSLERFTKLKGRIADLEEYLRDIRAQYAPNRSGHLTPRDYKTCLLHENRQLREKLRELATRNKVLKQESEYAKEEIACLRSCITEITQQGVLPTNTPLITKQDVLHHVLPDIVPIVRDCIRPTMESIHGAARIQLMWLNQFDSTSNVL